MRAKAPPLYRMMKRFIVHKQARQTVVLTPGKNPYEAWRLLHAKYAPRNDASAGMVVEKLVDWKAWKCKEFSEVPTRIQAWEKMQDEYKIQYRDEPINDITKRQMLKNILPDEVRSLFWPRCQVVCILFAR